VANLYSDHANIGRERLALRVFADVFQDPVENSSGPSAAWRLTVARS
jgi:hypothetical protein